MSTSSYDSVKQLVASKELRIIGIEAPARTSSTTLEIALSESPSVHTHSSQPFHIPNENPDGSTPSVDNPYIPIENREERAYSLILETFERGKATNSDRPVVVVVKEMSRNLGIGDQFSRWVELTDKNVLMVRDPQLSVESIIRLQLHDLEERQAVLTQDINQYAKDRGFEDIIGEQQGWRGGEIGLGQHWRKMVHILVGTESEIGKREYGDFTDILQEFSTHWDLNSQQGSVLADFITQITDEDAQKLGHASLNAFAKSSGHANWGTMLATTLRAEQINVSAFQPFLDRIFSASCTGWRHTETIAQKIEGHDYVVVDASVLRTHPEDILQELTQFLDIDYVPTMAKGWQKANRQHFDTSAFEPGFLSAFARARGSDAIEPPRESPIISAAFPPQFADHLKETAFPTYIGLLSDEKAVRPHGKEALNTLFDTAIGGAALRDIDPVFAYSMVITDMNLAKDDKSAMLAEIRTKYAKDFGDVFDRIDEIAAELEMGNRIGRRQDGTVGR